MTLDLRVNAVCHTYQAHLAYHYLPDVLPRDAVPILRFCATLAGGEQIAFTDPNGNVFGTASGAFDPVDWPEIYIQCAEQLAEIQDLAGAYFPLPLAFTPEDQADMDYARMLLRGEEVRASWSGMAAHPQAETVGNLLAQIEAHGQPFALAVEQEETLLVAGGRLPLGVVRHVVPSTRMSNLDQVRAWYQAGAEGTIEVRLEPGDGNNGMTIRHVPGGCLRQMQV